MMGHGGHNRNEEVNGTLFKSCFSAIRDRPDLISELKKYEQSAAHNFFLYITQLYKDQYAVFTHSDCWSANLLFKYGDESKPYLPTDISIIDWQTSAVSHPVHDISYFFFITAGKADLHNYKSYLRSYYEALCENLSDFGIEAKSFYPFELLEEHWKKYSIIGFIMCLVMLKQSLSSTKTRDLPKMADNGESLYNLGGTDDDSQLYEQRMTDLVEFLIENKLIQ